MRTHRKAVSLLVFSFAMLMVVIAAPTSALAASGYGELARFGERGAQGSCSVEHPTECTPTRAGLLAGAAKNVGEPSELNYAIGVDPAESNSVFVLDEPDEPTYHVVREIKATEEVFTSYIRHFRIQKFTKTGELKAQAEFSVESPEQEEEEEAPFESERVSNIAIDSADGTLYVLDQEPRSYKAKKDAEAPVAYELLAFSTATLAPAGTGGTDVLAGPTALSAASETIGAALIEPRGIAVDPSTHEVVILASEDHVGEEVDKPANNRYVLERVSSSGSAGERYVDSSGFFKTSSEEPLGVVVTPGGKVMVRYVGIAEVPYDFSSTNAPVQLQGKVPAEGNAKSVLHEAANESETGGQIVLSPEEKEKGYPARLYESSSVWEFKKKEKSEESTAVTEREAATGAVVGWTGGASSLANVDDECVLDPGTEKEPIDVAAGSEGRLFVLAPEYLTAPNEAFQPHTSKAVIELGPSGRGCPSARGSAAVVDVSGQPLSEGEPVLDHVKLGLSTEVGGADAIGEEWIIENKKTHKKVLEGPDMPLAFQLEETTNYELLQQPLFEYTFTEPGEYLITGKITSDSLATTQVETPTRTLIVDAKPEVTEGPVTQTDPVGGSANFVAEASGAPAPSIQWEVSTNKGANWSELSGQTSTVLTLTGLTAEQSGYEYRARFENTVGSQTNKALSASAMLTVTSGSSPAEVTEQPKSQSVVEGATAKFSTAGSGAPAPSIQWEVSTNKGVSWNELSGQTSANLKIENTTLAESGNEYRATLKNTGATKHTNAATLSVTAMEYVLPVVTVQPKNVPAVTEGGSASFSSQASGKPTPTEEWEVSSNGGSGWSATGVTTETLTLSNVSLSLDGYEYRACFTNTEPGGGKVHTVCSNAVTLTVKKKEEQQSIKPVEELSTPIEEKHVVVETSPPPEPTASIASTNNPTVSSAGAWTMKVSCPTAGTHCTGTLTIRTASAVAVGKAKKGKKPKKQILTLSSGGFSISGGASGPLTLHLSSQGRVLLAQTHTLRVKATITVGGSKHTVEEVLTLHLAESKKKKK